MTETDALVIGAGPVGLWVAFELGLQGIAAHLVDVLEEPGGQCVELYPDKPIYDIPGAPSCTGRELTQNLLAQIAPFSPSFHFGQQVSALERQSSGRWQVTTSVNNQSHQTFLARTVFIAAGVGAFVPKELKIDGLAAFLGRQLFYRANRPEIFAGKSVVIVGGEDVAVSSAIALASPGAHQAHNVTLVHRRDVLNASPDDLTRFAALRETGQISFVVGQITGIKSAGTGPAEALTDVIVTQPDDQNLTLPLDLLLVCQGISPKLGPIADWGLAMERKQLSVNLETFATSEPDIFAVGDIITYPGKRKLILSGFHEATLAALAAAARLRPEQSSALQYTTSSELLQRRLGVFPIQ